MAVIFYRYETHGPLVRQAYSFLEEPFKSTYPTGTKRQLAGTGMNIKVEGNCHTLLKDSTKGIALREAPELLGGINGLGDETIIVLYHGYGLK